jgi:hypothetical protein
MSAPTKKPASKVTPTKSEEILQAMGVSDCPGLYVINGGMERRVNIVAQQIRAISLINALFEQKLIRRGTDTSRIAIVGAGIAGITATCRAAYGGCHVTLFDKEKEPFGRIRDAKRYLHPRIDEWPHPDFSKKHAGLPLFSWESDEAEGVIQKWDQQWEEWQGLYKPGKKSGCIETHMSAKLHSVKQEHAPARWEMQWTTSKAEPPYLCAASFDIIILALGFGIEYGADIFADPENNPYTDYWQRQPKPFVPETKKVLLSGIGDSGLRDVIVDLTAKKNTAPKNTDSDEPCSILGKQMDFLVKKLKPLASTELAERISSLDEEAAADSVIALRSEFKNLLHGSSLRCLFEETPKVELLLQSTQPKSYLSAGSFPLNRFLLTALEVYGKITITEKACVTEKPSEAKNCARVVGKGKEVQVFWPKFPPWNDPNGEWLNVDRAYYRHGGAPDYGIFNNLLNREKARRQSVGISYETHSRIFNQVSKKPGELILYSDLHDSTVQKKLVAGANHSEKYKDYKKRFEDALKCYDRIILTDSQLLDGVFFQKYLGTKKNREAFAKYVQEGKIILKFRKPTVWESLVDILMDYDENQKTWKARGFHLSSVQRKFTNKVVSKIYSSFSTFKVRENEQPKRLVNIYMNKLRTANLRKFRVQRKSLLNHLETLKKLKLRLEPWFTDLDLAGSFEDPGAFVSGLEEKDKQIARIAFAEEKRSLVHDDLIKHPKVEDWYNRAYNRALAKQHGATVCETVYVRHGFPFMKDLKLSEPKMSDLKHDGSTELGEHLLNADGCIWLEKLDATYRIHDSISPNSCVVQLHGQNIASLVEFQNPLAPRQKKK